MDAVQTFIVPESPDIGTNLAAFEGSDGGKGACRRVATEHAIVGHFVDWWYKTVRHFRGLHPRFSIASLNLCHSKPLPSTESVCRGFFTARPGRKKRLNA